MDIHIGRRGIFYKSSNRGLPGVDWRMNFRLPDHIRHSDHSILLDRDLVQNIWYKDAYLYVDIYYKDNFKGTYRIAIQDIIWWRDKIGYYTAHSGKDYLAVPMAMWRRIKEGDTPKVSQLKLL